MELLSERLEEQIKLMSSRACHYVDWLMLRGIIGEEIQLHCKATEDATRTVRSLSVMLGWSNVPSRDVLERSVKALVSRIAELKRELQERNVVPVYCPACGKQVEVQTTMKGQLRQLINPATQCSHVCAAE